MNANFVFKFENTREARETNKNTDKTPSINGLMNDCFSCQVEQKFELIVRLNLFFVFKFSLLNTQEMMNLRERERERLVYKASSYSSDGVGGEEIW